VRQADHVLSKIVQVSSQACHALATPLNPCLLFCFCPQGLRVLLSALAWQQSALQQQDSSSSSSTTTCCSALHLTSSLLRKLFQQSRAHVTHCKRTSSQN
jgi:hypothetical protein